LRVSLGTFACSCIEARFGEDIGTAVETALDRYADRIESRTRDLPMPLFWFGRDTSEAQVELDVQVDSRKRRLFEVEARRQDLTIEQLLTHAVFLCLGAQAVYKTARIPVRM
jgi:hypothetical protein